MLSLPSQGLRPLLRYSLPHLRSPSQVVPARCIVGYRRRPRPFRKWPLPSRGLSCTRVLNGPIHPERNPSGSRAYTMRRPPCAMTQSRASTRLSARWTPTGPKAVCSAAADEDGPLLGARSLRKDWGRRITETPTTSRRWFHLPCTQAHLTGQNQEKIAKLRRLRRQ